MIEMTSASNRGLMLFGVAVAVFVISIVVLTQLLPGPHTVRDYFIIGCLSTLVSLLALFLIVVTTWIKTPNPFNRRRKP
jgi:hypothetical protein